MSRSAQVAISSEGFIFDLMSGECFRVDTTGLLILRACQEKKAVETIVREMENRFREVP